MSGVRPANQRVGALAVLAAAALWALLGVWSRELGDVGVEPTTIAWWRAGGGGLCFLAQALAQRVPLRVDRPDRVPLAWFTIVGVSFFYASVPLAVEAGGVTLAFVLLYTAPVWVVIGGSLVARRWPAPNVVTLVFVGVAGTALVVGGGGTGVVIDASSVIWGLTAGISYASYYLVGRGLFDRRGAIATYAVALPVGAVPLAMISGFALPTGSQWWLVAGLVVVSTFVPYQLLAFGLRSVPPARAVVIATVEPVVAAAIGWAVYDERLSALAAVGAVLVVGAATAASITRTEPVARPGS